MQLWTRLSLGFALTATVIVGMYGVYQLRQESHDLRAAAERDLRVMGGAVQVAVGNALRDSQHADTQAILNIIKLRDPSVDVMVFDAAGVLAAGSWGSSRNEARARALLRESQTANRAVLRFDGADDAQLLGAFPIRTDGRRVGTLAVIRPLDEANRDLTSETRATILSLLTLIGGLTLAGWILAVVYVRRPLRALVDTMRKVRGGDLSAKVARPGSDEIGAAITEFNLLTDDLAHARRSLIAEAEAREVLEMSLQRADKLVAVGQLSAGLAHEIGSPLQVVNGRARSLAARADLPADIRRVAEILADQSDRIAGIVEQLLKYSSRSAPCMGAADISLPVADIVELLGPESRRHHVSLEFSCEDMLPAAVVDVGQVQQVVMNLITNAVRASPPGGRVTITLCASSFTLEGEPRQPSVAIAVEDEGAGIPDAVLPRIFEPFFTTGEATGGTGLGLAVVRSIVDAHGGTIAVQTRAGEGTRFTVHLPVKAARAGGRVA